MLRRKQKRPALLRTDFVFLVEPWGIEPQTSRVRLWTASKSLDGLVRRFVPQPRISVEDSAERFGGVSRRAKGLSSKVGV